MVTLLKHTETEIQAETQTFRVVITEGGIGVIPLDPPIVLPPPIPPKEEDIDLLFPYKPYIGRSRISFNVDALAMGNTRPYFLNLCRDLQPTTVLVINDDPKYELCQQIHAVSPTTIIVHRKYLKRDERSGWEGNFWEIDKGDGTFVSPSELVDHIVSGAPDYVIHNLGNEPSPNFDNDSFDKMTDFLIKAMDYATSIGRKLLVWNVQSVAINWDDLQKGLMDRLIRRLAVNDHYVGFHEYTFAVLQLDSSGLAWNLLESEHALKTDWWATAETFQKETLQHSHLGRCRLIDARCIQLGIEPPLKIISEFGWDKVLNQDHPTVIKINNEAKELGFDLALGAPTLIKTWERLYPQFNWQQFEAQQLLWSDTVYDETVLGFDVFGWNFLQEWNPFNVAEHVGMHVLLIEYAKRRPQADVTRRKVRIKSTTGLNIRLFPSTAAPKIGNIPFSATVYSMDIYFQEPNEGNQWLLVSSNGVIGWIARWLIDENVS